jgi:hypothetical protein
MRPAPPIDDTLPDAAPPSPPSRGPRRSRLIVAVCVGLAVLLVGGIVALLSFGGEGTSVTEPNPSAGPATTPAGSPSPGPPARPPLFFRIDKVVPVRTDKPNRQAAQDAAIEIAGRLSAFYDTAFLDPDVWDQRLPVTAWVMFDRSVVGKAKDDASSLTLQGSTEGLASLDAGETSLTITVLLDPAGRPDSAFADVDFAASGSLTDGQAIGVTNTATYLFELVDGEWMVVGYPDAKTTLSSSSAAPSAEPSGTAPSTSPSAGSSP